MASRERQADECRARGRQPRRDAAQAAAPRSLSAPPERVAPLLAAEPPLLYLSSITAILSSEQRRLLAQELESQQLVLQRQKAEQEEWATAARELLARHICDLEPPAWRARPPYPPAAAHPRGPAQHKRHWCEAEKGGPGPEPEEQEPDHRRCRGMLPRGLHLDTAAAGAGDAAAAGCGGRLPWSDEELRQRIAGLEREIAMLEHGAQPGAAAAAAWTQAERQLAPCQEGQAWQGDPRQPCAQRQPQQACQPELPPSTAMPMQLLSSAFWGGPVGGGGSQLGCASTDSECPGRLGLCSLQPAGSLEALSFDAEELLRSFGCSEDGHLASTQYDPAACAAHVCNGTAVSSGVDVAAPRALPSTQQGPIIFLPDLPDCHAAPSEASPVQLWGAAFDLPDDESWQHQRHHCQPPLPLWYEQQWGRTRRSL